MKTERTFGSSGPGRVVVAVGKKGTAIRSLRLLPQAAQALAWGERARILWVGPLLGDMDGQVVTYKLRRTGGGRDKISAGASSHWNPVLHADVSANPGLQVVWGLPGPGALWVAEPQVWAAGRGLLTLMGWIPAHNCSVSLKLWYLLLFDCRVTRERGGSSAQILYGREIAHTASHNLEAIFFLPPRHVCLWLQYYIAHINIVIFSASEIVAGSYNGITYISISWCSAKSPITSRCSATWTSLGTTDL